MKMEKGKILARLVCGALLASGHHAYAASAADDAQGMDTYTLGDVVVTATRSEKNDVDVPAATTVITADEIKASGAAHASDALAQVNGFTYKSFGPNGASMGSMTNEVNLRGVKGGALVLMNGNPISWRGKYNLDAIPASAIERIEVVKGSGSVLYGSEAVSGVVNIITKQHVQNEVHAGFGSYGQRSAGMSVGDDRFSVYYNYDKWGHQNGLTYTNVAQRQFKGETRTDIHDVEKKNLGIGYHINPRLDFLFNLYESSARYQRYVMARHAGSIPLTIGEPYNNRKYETKQYVTQLNYHDADWKGSLYFNTSTMEFAGSVYFNGRGGARTPDGFYDSREKNMTYGLDLQRTWQVNAKATAILGVDFEHEYYAALPTVASNKDDRYSRNNWGIFGQWEQRFDERNTGIFGLRETWTTGAAKRQNFHNLSASGQWLHKLNAESSLYLNISQSFVMPTFAQMYGENGRQLPASNLRPQTGVNYEIGWKKSHGGHIWKAALFHMNVKDNITAKVNTGRTEYQYTNEDFRNTGVELSADIRGTHGFSYNWGLTWQNPETNSTAVAGGWDRAFGKIQLTGGIHYQKGKWNSALTASYLASRVQSPSAQRSYAAKPYLLTTWNTSYAPDDHSEISLRIDNVLDRKDTTMHSGTVYYTAPINYLLSYSYRF